SLGLAMAGIGFNLGHDGGHGSISRHGFINRLMAQMFDFMGASSYVLHFKHNVFYHSYPNIVRADAELPTEPMARLSPHQPRRGFHRFQFLYLWVLYGFLPLKWQFHDDFNCIARARIARNEFPRPWGWRLAEVIFGKMVFITWQLLIPALL